MHNLIRYYNQNRKKVWLVIAIVVFALILLRTINNIVAEQKRLEEENKVENTIVDVKSSMSEDYAIMSDEKIEENVKEENTDIIDKFFKACNLKNIEEAYNMLSDACKEVKYPTLESFENTYYNTIFTTQRSFDKEAWMERNDAYTYRMAIIEDPLATGRVSYSDSFQDFYTVVKQGQDLKLNISSFVIRENIEKGTQLDNVTYNVKYRDCFMDYEEYVIEVTNNTDKVIALDSLENAKSTYLIGESDNKFSSYSGEMNNTYNKNNNDEAEDSINDNQLKQNNSITNNIIVPANTIKKISIKFNKMYNPERKIAKMEFSDVIEDYDYYLELKNKDDYNRKTVTINL